MSGKSNPIAEYIKMEAVKIECEITKGRSMWEVVPGREAKQDRIFSRLNKIKAFFPQNVQNQDHFRATKCSQ